MDEMRLGWTALALSAAWMAAVAAYCGWVHYPTFLIIPPDQWASFHARHTSMTGLLVGPALLVQVAATAGVALQTGGALRWIVVGLSVFSLLWTFAVSAPDHGRLAAGWDETVIRHLIATNWPRTLAWFLLALVAGWQASLGQVSARIAE